MNFLDMDKLTMDKHHASLVYGTKHSSEKNLLNRIVLIAEILIACTSTLCYFVVMGFFFSSPCIKMAGHVQNASSRNNQN